MNIKLLLCNALLGEHQAKNLFLMIYDCFIQSNVESERKKVTKLLAKMFSDPGSTLADQNRALWNCFLGR